MKKNVLTAALGFAITLMAGFGTTVNAQSAKTIEEVTIRNEENFSYLKNLLQQNFDYTHPDLKEGLSKAVLKFEVSDNGKITNVKAEGRNEEMNREIVNALKGILYRASFKSSPYVYVVPVELQLASN